jgi:hypothetical protein
MPSHVKLVTSHPRFLQSLANDTTGGGNVPPEERYPELHAWVETGVVLIDETLAIADQHGFDAPTRQKTTIMLEKRATAVEVLFANVRHNLTLEYPKLMHARVDHNLTTLYAMNLNDQFFIAQITQAMQAGDIQVNEPVLNATLKLENYLQNIPSTNISDA